MPSKESGRIQQENKPKEKRGQMPQVKMFEIRDRMTFIPAMAIRMGSDIHGPLKIDDREAERFLQSSLGLGLLSENQMGYMFLVDLRPPGKIVSNFYDWCNSRTWGTAHKYIQENWDILPTGAVIDVEFILDETTNPKQSERFQCHRQ